MASVAGYETIPLRDACGVTAGPSGALLDNLHDGPDGVPVVTPPDITDQHTIDARRVRRVPDGTRPRSCPGSNSVRATSCMSARAQSAVSRSSRRRKPDGFTIPRSCG